VLTERMATLEQLDTVYGSQDLADMIEIVSINAHNSRVLNAKPPGK
jgi:hypothetical protein